MIKIPETRMHGSMTRVLKVPVITGCNMTRSSDRIESLITALNNPAITQKHDKNGFE